MTKNERIDWLGRHLVALELEVSELRKRVAVLEATKYQPVAVPVTPEPYRNPWENPVFTWQNPNPENSGAALVVQ